MIKITNFLHMIEVIRFAEKVGKLENLLENLERFEKFDANGYGVTLGPDFAPYSFTFSLMNGNGTLFMAGGLIYHGPLLDGSRPETFSVQLVSTDGWAMHT